MLTPSQVGKSITPAGPFAIQENIYWFQELGPEIFGGHFSTSYTGLFASFVHPCLLSLRVGLPQLCAICLPYLHSLSLTGHLVTLIPDQEYSSQISMALASFRWRYGPRLLATSLIPPPGWSGIPFPPRAPPSRCPPVFHISTGSW